MINESSLVECQKFHLDVPCSLEIHDYSYLYYKAAPHDVNKLLTPLLLTPVLSKLAEDFVLAKVEPMQFGTVPGSNTTEAQVSMIHT